MTADSILFTDVVEKSTKKFLMPLSVRRMSPRESCEARRCTMQVRELLVAPPVLFGPSEATQWLISSYRRRSSSLCVHVGSSNISRDTLLDAFSDLRPTVESGRTNALMAADMSHRDLAPARKLCKEVHTAYAGDAGRSVRGDIIECMSNKSADL